jgi:hypothetical protein
MNSGGKMHTNLSERLKGFKPIKYTRVTRDGASYAQTEVFVRRALRLCLWTYKRLESANQTARLLRDVIDFVLRRYHGYCIKEKLGAHYREVGLKPNDKVDFEHVLPAALARDLLIHDRISIDEALNVPTCMISRKKHKKLNSKKLASTTPDPYNFWTRYEILNIKIETHDSTEVDMATWNLDSHYQYFKVL